MLERRISGLQEFWKDSGAVAQNGWNNIYEFFDSDDYSLAVWGTFWWTFIVYWAPCICYTAMDVTGKPASLLQYKIQDQSSNRITRRRILKTAYQVLINQTIIGIPCLILIHTARKWYGYNSDKTLPTFQTVIVELAAFGLIEDASFYYTHRLLHHPYLYRRIHKYHHRWTSPIALATLDCHPIEHVLSNMFTVQLGPLLFRSHTATVWLWAAMATVIAMNDHSGFHSPFSQSAEAHDYHHLKFNQNFGPLGIFDRLHGTDGAFRQSKQYQRHFMSFSLTPLKELFPDDDAKMM